MLSKTDRDGQYQGRAPTLPSCSQSSRRRWELHRHLYQGLNRAQDRDQRVDSKTALFHYTARTTIHFWCTPFWHHGIIIIKCFPIERSSLIRTRYLAIPTPNAALIVHHDNAVITVICCLNRADFFAWGIFAM